MTLLDTRCPQCSALLRGDAAWCTLCHADLRPPPEPEPEPEPPVAVVIDPLTAPLDQVLAQAGSPVVDLPAADLPVPTAVPEAGPDEDEASESFADIDDTDVMFALLRAQSQDPLLAKYGGRFESKGSRVVFVAGAASVLTLVLFGCFTLFGLIFG